MKKTITRKEYVKFINRLIKARKSVNLKQSDVAKKLNRHQSYVSRVESGEYRVDVMELKDFSKVYKINPSKLID